MSRIALFGGSFNPPHEGHLMVVAWLLSTARADEVWAIPTANHPFGKSLAPFDARVRMTKAAFSHYGDRVRVLDLEGMREGPSFTIDTVEALRAQHPEHRYSLIVGTDVLAESPKWKSFDRLKTLVDLITVRRAGVAGSEPDPDPAHPTPLFPDVSSTAIRERLSHGESVDGLVPAAVRDTIDTLGLYRTSPEKNPPPGAE
jgi:nicotinate-nucleotide adenylyltransferase